MCGSLVLPFSKPNGQPGFPSVGHVYCFFPRPKGRFLDEELTGAYMRGALSSGQSPKFTRALEMLQEIQRGMNSNTIRGIRRKKSSLSEVKVAVIGAPGVGKSALTVRFLTKRYIGEYDHQADMRYKHEVMVDGEPILFEILDTCPKTENEFPMNDTLNWADGCLLVYSITDRISFNYVRKVKEILSEMPVALVGNKGDMVHLRQVSTDEGEILAKDYECWFSEIAAAEQVSQVAEAFHELCREVLNARKRNKQSLLDRMLGSGKSSVKAYARGKSDSALPKE